MSQLRQQLIDALVVRGRSPRTIEAYVEWVAKLSRHCGKSPRLIDSEECQRYLLHLIRERRLARASVNQASCAFRFFFGVVLGVDGTQFSIPLAPAEQKLPEVLSRLEVAKLLASCEGHPKAHALLSCAYGLGLRASELCALRPEDIDSQADRMCVRVRQGKGAKDRYVPLSQGLLLELRGYWCQSHPRPRVWLFTAQLDREQPLPLSYLQRCYHRARQQAGIRKVGGVHTLRHCYATHLLESGVDLHCISQWLGHGAVSTTARYLHLAQPGVSGARMQPLQLLESLPKLNG